jgi:hypothetical protein
MRAGSPPSSAPPTNNTATLSGCLRHDSQLEEDHPRYLNNVDLLKGERHRYGLPLSAEWKLIMIVQRSGWQNSCEPAAVADFSGISRTRPDHPNKIENAHASQRSCRAQGACRCRRDWASAVQHGDNGIQSTTLNKNYGSCPPAELKMAASHTTAPIRPPFSASEILPSATGNKTKDRRPTMLSSFGQEAAAAFDGASGHFASRPFRATGVTFNHRACWQHGIASRNAVLCQLRTQHALAWDPSRDIVIRAAYCSHLWCRAVDVLLGGFGVEPHVGLVSRTRWPGCSEPWTR